MDGFIFIIKNNVISIHREDMFYGNALLSNGLYILHLENQKPIYNIDTKWVISNIKFWKQRIGARAYTNILFIVKTYYMAMRCLVMVFIL